MRIKTVELINLRSYDHVKIDLSSRINLLTGANNSGKSTIIHSLLNLQYHQFQKGDIRALENYAKIFTEIVDIGEKDNLSFYNSQAHNEYEAGDKFTILWGGSNSEQPEENLYYNSQLNVKRVEFNKVKLQTKKGLVDLKVKKFPRFSDFENKNNFIYPFLAKRKTDFYNSTSTKDETFRVTETLRNLAAKIQKIGNSSHPQNQRFIDLCVDILGFKIGVIPSEQNNSGMEPGIYVTDTSLISIKTMGEGVANIVGFIILLLTENNKLYLIEEIENDIHPTALKKLLALISEKSIQNQFVISTHSHIVLKYLGVTEGSKIFYINWSSTNSQGQNVPTSEISEVPNTPEKRIEILEKLGYDFFDFELFNSYLILEESTAERIIRDFLIPTFVPSLYGKIKTIAARGVDDMEKRIADFNRLFVFIHTSPAYFKKAWVMADGDEAGKTSIKNLQTTFATWPKDHFLNFKSVAFEKYYPTRFQADVEKVLHLSHGLAKQKAKGDLALKVMNWALTNDQIAKKEFEISAKEVIALLKGIDKHLNTRRRK
jgi:predicted ATPase